MPDNPRRANGGGWAALAVGLVLLVLYVAISGPMFAMALRGQLDWDLYAALYFPVHWAARHNDDFGEWMLRYWFWWDRHWPGEPLLPEYDPRMRVPTPATHS
jgi:hypothetical protein